MKPILFDKDATTFATNGIGRLDCISCNVTEERNGQYELEMIVPEDALHANEIEMSSIIVVKPSQNGSNQAFRVYKVTKPFNGRFSVLAQHISYQLSYIPTMPFSVAADSSACANTLAGLKNNAAEDCPFTFSTDVTTISSYTQTIPASIRSRLGGIEGSVLDQFGGEYEWDNYNVKLWKNRGVTTPQVTLRYGKNITDISQEEYISNTITGICPYWQDVEGTNIVTLPEKVVESAYASSYPFRRTITVDMSQDFETAPTVSELRDKANDYLTKEGIGVPTVSIKVSFVNLADTEEYKDIAPLQNVSLCDRISVQFEKLGISTTAKIVKTVYDVLAERYSSIEIGSVKPSLAQTITDTNGLIETSLNTTNFNIKNATAWLTGGNGYVMAVKNDDGTWKELLFMDTDDAETAVNVLRINQNGIGFSRNGVSGPYTQAWTLDGRLVIGGTNVPSFTVMKNNVEVFKLDKDALDWNYSATGKTAIQLSGNQILIRDWSSSGTDRIVGAIGTTKTTSGGVTEDTVFLVGRAENDDASNKTAAGIGIDRTGGGVYYAFRYDSQMHDDNEPPYIIHTANGTIFSDLPNDGGITVKNGLITDWNITAPSYGDSFLNGITGIKLKSGMITELEFGQTYTGNIPTGANTLHVTNGLITGVS